MRTGTYTVRQVNLLREELNAVYARAKNEQGNKLVSWGAIAAWIEEAFKKLSDRERKSIAEPYRKIKSINLSENDSFRKFSKGQSKTMDTIKLIALDIWLTEKDDCWSQLTTDKLRGLNDYSKVAASLKYFLFENNHEQPALNVDNLVGVYAGVYCAVHNQKNESSEFNLSIEKSSTPHVVLAEAEYSAKKSFLVKQESKNTIAVSVNNNKLSGWIAVSPEDNIICYLKEIESGSNHIYYLIAVNDGIFDGAKADCLVFLDRQIPSEISDAKKSSDFSSYLIDWAEENKSNLMMFRRQ